MEVFDDFDYYNNIFDENHRRLEIGIPRRLLRDVSNYYHMEEHIFRKKYRFSQDVVLQMILPKIITDLTKPDNRGCPIPPEIQILVCLRFYATASFQVVCGDLLHVSQPTVSHIVTRISRCLAKLHLEYIKYPDNLASLATHRQKFCQRGQYGQWPGFNKVDGAIDCTHIKLVHTPGVQHHEAYRNRKSYFSVNVQAVVGPDGYFIDMVARWAGSTHDSRIFQLSRINMKYIQGTHDGILVGDSGYPSLRYLITPVNPPTCPAEERYNKVHVKTRNIVERTFGMWKRRFPCLSRGLGNKLTTVPNIIIACAVLHNTAIRVQDPLPNDDFEIIDDDIEPNVNNLGSRDGFALRNSIINNYM